MRFANLVAALIATVAAELVAAELNVAATVAVMVEHAGGARSHGSGAAVDVNGDGLVDVITNAHVVAEPGRVLVWSARDNTWSPATVGFALKNGPDDLAILRTNRRVDSPDDVAWFAAADPQPGSRVVTAGFAHGTQRAIRSGVIVPNRATPIGATLTYTTPNVEGESGSPVFDTDGRIVGLHWGNADVAHGMTRSRMLTVLQTAGCSGPFCYPVGRPQPRPQPQPTRTTIRVGETITGPAGTPAAVRNVGNGRDVVLQFTIPRGSPGERGPVGRVELTDDELRRVAEYVFELIADDPRRLAAILPEQRVEISTGPAAAGGLVVSAAAKLGDPLRVELPPVAATIRDGDQTWSQTRPLGRPLSFVVTLDDREPNTTTVERPTLSPPVVELPAGVRGFEHGGR